MRRSHKFIMHYAPSRILSNIPLSRRRTVGWFRLYFPFFECFCLFYMLLKIEDFNTFPFPRLVNIQINGLICWMVGSNGIIWVCSTLVGWPGDVSSIERPDDGLIPESFLAVDVQRRGLDDTRPTIPQEQHDQYFYFYFDFLFHSYPPLRYFNFHFPWSDWCESTCAITC
jgi:hypothetical protein